MCTLVVTVTVLLLVASSEPVAAEVWPHVLAPVCLKHIRTLCSVTQ